MGGAADPRLSDPVDACRCCTTANVLSEYEIPGDDTSAVKLDTGDRSIAFMWTKFMNDQMDYLEDDLGIFVYRELECPQTLLENITVTASVESDYVDFVFTGVDSLKEARFVGHENGQVHSQASFPQAARWPNMGRIQRNCRYYRDCNQRSHPGFDACRVHSARA